MIGSKVEAFRALHSGRTFIVANAWDGATARVLAAQGFPALATSSAAAAATLGRADGRITRDEALAAARHVVCSTHGELVHASAPCEADRGASDPCADTPHALQEEVEPTSAALGASDPLELPADEHCLIVVLSRTCFVSWETRGAHFELPRAGQILATERREAPALSIEPIALAPKQSPPV